MIQGSGPSPWTEIASGSRTSRHLPATKTSGERPSRPETIPVRMPPELEPTRSPVSPLRSYPSARFPFRLPAVLLSLAVCLQAQESNLYRAPFAATAPVLDGVADPVWANAPWDSLPYNYLPGTPLPTAADLSARYKVLWTADALHLLVEVVDDSLSDRIANPLQGWWNDDCVEIFLDENRDGGDHQYNFEAWAYHVSTKGEVVDYGDDRMPHLFNDHVRLRRTTTGDTSIWEMAIQVHGEGYTLEGPNTPQTLSAPRTMGFSLAYCDNDGKTNRESFLGSVNTPGHINNEGYLDASVFGALELVPPGSTTALRKSPSGAWEVRRDGFRLRGDAKVSVRDLGGRRVSDLDAVSGIWIGTDLPSGLYAVEALSADGSRSSFLFARP